MWLSSGGGQAAARDHICAVASGTCAVLAGAAASLARPDLEKSAGHTGPAASCRYCAQRWTVSEAASRITERRERMDHDAAPR